MYKIITIIRNLFCVMLISLVVVACGNRTKETGSSADTEVTKEKPASEAMVEGLPTVIDFYATWCGPCKAISPLFEMLRSEYSDRINFRSVDVDIQTDVAEKYNITAMPTFVFLDSEGNEINRIVGADRNALASAVESLATK